MGNLYHSKLLAYQRVSVTFVMLLSEYMCNYHGHFTYSYLKLVFFYKCPSKYPTIARIYHGLQFIWVRLWDLCPNEKNTIMNQASVALCELVIIFSS